jgi:hypothetical protein
MVEAMRKSVRYTETDWFVFKCSDSQPAVREKLPVLQSLVDYVYFTIAERARGSVVG